MRTIKNWKTFNEQNNSEFITNFYIPCAVEKDIKEEIFGYYDDPTEICAMLEKDGFNCSWFETSYNGWLQYSKPKQSYDEPQREDYDNDDDYEAELSEWNENNDEYESWEPSIDQYVKDEWNDDWNKFVSEFKISGPVSDVVDNNDKYSIFNKLKSSFNESDLVEYFDESESLGVTSIKVVGNNFDEDSRFTVEVKSTKELEDVSTVIDYLEGQCADGWGEGFEQQDINGFSVHTWWSGDSYDAGIYEIKTD